MDKELFEEFTPWDRIVNLTIRIEQLEHNMNEVAKALNLQHQHLLELNHSVLNLHKELLETKLWQNPQ